MPEQIDPQQRRPQPPRPSPHDEIPSVGELAASLISDGIPVWEHGDALLAELRPDSAPSTRAPTATFDDGATEIARAATRSLLCESSPERLLEVLPRAVVTAAGARRLTFATRGGPIDLLPLGERPIEAALVEFGLSALALARHASHGTFCDPVGALADLRSGQIGLATAQRNPFRADRGRVWLAARMMAEYDLEPTTGLLEAARADQLTRIPQGAPAWRALRRILLAPNPERGLRFLFETGQAESLFPGIEALNAEIVGRLAPDLALRLAAWLRGCELRRALRRMRVPERVGQRVDRLLRIHPIDQLREARRDGGLRRLVHRLGEDELSRLIAWREVEIARCADPSAHDAARARLDALLRRLEGIRLSEDRSGRIQALALDGEAVMRLLECPPGRRVGEALAHLARFVEHDATRNQATRLEAELRAWAARPDSARIG